MLTNIPNSPARFNAKEFMAWMKQDFPDTFPLLTSGILYDHARLKGAADGGNARISMPFWSPPSDEIQYRDGLTDNEPKTIQSGEVMAGIVRIMDSIEFKTIENEITRIMNDSPSMSMEEAVGQFLVTQQQKQKQRLLLDTLVGAANAPNVDLIVEVPSFDSVAFLNATQKLFGDNMDQKFIVIMSSVDNVAYLAGAQNKQFVDFLAGHTIIVNDYLTKNADGTRRIIVSLPNAVAFADLSVDDRYFADVDYLKSGGKRFVGYNRSMVMSPFMLSLEAERTPVNSTTYRGDTLREGASWEGKALNPNAYRFGILELPA